jgi:hypothetical protein
MAQITINEADANNMVLQSLDGTTCISMGNGSIAMRSTTLTHNGVDISSMHMHSLPNITLGDETGESGVPNA